VSRVTIPVLPGAELVIERDSHTGLYVHLQNQQMQESAAFMFAQPSELHLLVMRDGASLCHGRAHFRVPLDYVGELREAFPNIKVSEHVKKEPTHG
jgi:hypothetical protein